MRKTVDDYSWFKEELIKRRDVLKARREKLILQVSRTELRIQKLEEKLAYVRSK